MRLPAAIGSCWRGVVQVRRGNGGCARRAPIVAGDHGGRAPGSAGRPGRRDDPRDGLPVGSQSLRQIGSKRYKARLAELPMPHCENCIREVDILVAECQQLAAPQHQVKRPWLTGSDRLLFVALR